MTIWQPSLENRAGPAYRAIADAIADDLAKGKLSAGERLPTHRRLAERLGVTVGTVSRAYAEAERRGLIAGEVGRGTYIRSPPRPIQTLLTEELRQSGVIDLSINTVALGNEQRAFEAALAEMAHGENLPQLLQYQPHAGALSHREGGAAWMTRAGLEIDPGRIVMCSGGQNAMALAFSALTRSGDCVLTEQLTYPGFKALAGLLGLRLQGIAMDREGIVPEALDQAAQSGVSRILYLMPTQQNPTTATMSRERREKIVAVARRRELTIVEDDVYGFLEPNAAATIAELAPDLTVYFTSLSKSLMPGLRIGYLTAPARILERIAAVVRASLWMANPLAGETATLLIRSGEADRIAHARRTEAAARQQLAASLLEGLDVVARPQAFHLWLTLPEPWRRDEFVAAMRHRGVIVMSAEAFAVGRGPLPHSVRICLCGTPTRAELETGLRHVGELLSGRPEPFLSIV
jgi:DNA-binding transcriptional MocR family regulator